jgi:uncharacterized lipoprotein
MKTSSTLFLSSVVLALLAGCGESSSTSSNTQDELINRLN